MKNSCYLLLLSFCFVSAQQVQLVRDSIASTKDTLVISIKNNMLSPMFFKVTPKIEAAKKIRFMERIVIPGDSMIRNYMEVPRTMLDSVDAKFDFNGHFKAIAGYGDPKTVKPDRNYLYLLPYKKKKKLIQGNFGKFSHDHIGSYHAFDFGTQIGDTIYAAREGKVVITKSDSKKHGRTRKFINDANYVIIEHEDGTTASYYHLRFNGVLIEKGDVVQRGQAIGVSGMTGFTTTPHLHFVVRKVTEKDGNISIPIQFEGYEGKRFKKGKKYVRKTN